MWRSLPRLARTVKKSTGITGLEVVPNSKEVLIARYQKNLEMIQPIPKTYQYRIDLEAMYGHRLKILRSSDDVEYLENTIGRGQLEELIDYAEDEAKLIPEILDFKPWEGEYGETEISYRDDPGVDIPIPFEGARDGDAMEEQKEAA